MIEHKASEIFVLGSFVMGFTIKTKRLPVIGETLMGDHFNLGVGGKGFNQAIAAARAGASVNTLLCIGDDYFGSLAKGILLKEGMSTDYLHEIGGASSGCGFVTLLDSGENTIVIDSGANKLLNPSLVEKASNMIAKSKILMAQLEIPMEAVEVAFELGKRNGCLNILNPAPARTLSKELLKNTDILTPNETEAKIILGIAPDADIDLATVADRLLSTGVRTIIITMGKNGALIISEDGTTRIPAPKIEAVDPTGAGDCFNGNLAAALAEGKSIKEAVEWAVIGGAFCAKHLGVIDGLPYRKDLLNFKQDLKYN